MIQSSMFNARRHDLLAHADTRGVDWRSRLADFPDDDVLLWIIALATMLELDAIMSLDSAVSIADLEEDRAARGRAAELLRLQVEKEH